MKSPGWWKPQESSFQPRGYFAVCCIDECDAKLQSLETTLGKSKARDAGRAGPAGPAGRPPKDNIAMEYKSIIYINDIQPTLPIKNGDFGDFLCAIDAYTLFLFFCFYQITMVF